MTKSNITLSIDSEVVEYVRTHKLRGASEIANKALRTWIDKHKKHAGKQVTIAVKNKPKKKAAGKKKGAGRSSAVLRAKSDRPNGKLLSNPLLADYARKHI